MKWEKRGREEQWCKGSTLRWLWKGARGWHAWVSYTPNAPSHNQVIVRDRYLFNYNPVVTQWDLVCPFQQSLCNDLGRHKQMIQLLKEIPYSLQEPRAGWLAHCSKTTLEAGTPPSVSDESKLSIEFGRSTRLYPGSIHKLFPVNNKPLRCYEKGKKPSSICSKRQKRIFSLNNATVFTLNGHFHRKPAVYGNSLKTNHAVSINIDSGF